ncbi:hypothetical protein KQX54_011335 [Cotesia glomerata]|uniref:Endonuclease/exonuclease/phosphatase domain-containing protein n=1 Tax=Cotesia glomerata TaxID=32391 RepID=A0AAV7J9F4_COTGL|nr:hypothetical protein KQX54_011335 [Cotesia glomerata]
MSKNYTCARCKGKIVRAVESCRGCLKDFHPSCTKAHKIYDSQGHIVPCNGERELFNLDTKGQKSFRRRSTYEYETETIDNAMEPSVNTEQIYNANNENNNIDSDSNNNQKNSVNNRKISVDNNDNNNDKITTQIDLTANNSTESIDQLNTNNLKIMKDEIQKIIHSEMSILRNIFKGLIREEINKISEGLINEMIEIKNSLKEVKEICHLYINNNKNQSADISNQNNNITSIRKNVERILITPINNQESNVTLQQITDNINVTELGVGVNSVRKNQGGKVTLEVENEADKISLSNEIQSKFGNSYEIRTLHKKSPKLKIVKVEESILSIDKDKFIKDLIQQNNFSDIMKVEQDIKLIKRYNTRRGYGSILLEVSPILHKHIMNTDKIMILGDFNVDISKNTHYSTKLLNECAFLGFKQKIEKPTRTTFTSDTTIDLVFTNFQLDTSVLLTPKISDHNIVILNIRKINNPNEDLFYYTRNKKNLDYDLFFSKLDDKVNNVIYKNDLNNTFDSIEFNAAFNMILDSMMLILDEMAPKVRKIIKAKWNL